MKIEHSELTTACVTTCSYAVFEFSWSFIYYLFLSSFLSSKRNNFLTKITKHSVEMLSNFGFRQSQAIYSWAVVHLVRKSRAHGVKSIFIIMIENKKRTVWISLFLYISLIALLDKQNMLVLFHQDGIVSFRYFIF